MKELIPQCSCRSERKMFRFSLAAAATNWKGLLADQRFRHNPAAQRAFSKLRTAHAGLYAWRATQGEQPELVSEAIHCFNQALELCPYNPEAAS